MPQLTDVAIKLTEPGRQLPKFVETAELKQARREALQQPPGLEIDVEGGEPGALSPTTTMAGEHEPRRSLRLLVLQASLGTANTR